MDGPSILIVEDERIVARDLQGTLEKLGYAVCGLAATGEDAVDLALGSRPDLVLMDIVLAGEMSGVDAAMKIREVADIPVVYLTAYADDATLQRAKVSEPFGYLVKPFEERELHTSIEMALYKHQMERKLRLSERWLSTTLRSIGDAVIATDDRGRVKFMNGVAETLTGWPEDEAEGRELVEVFDIVNEDTREPSENPVARTLREGVVVGLANHTVLISRNGSERPIADSAAPIRDDGGAVSGVVMVFRDTSEERRVEQERQRVQKLESVGILAGGIAHDFNLLTAIVGNVSYAKILLPPQDEARERLDEAEKASWRAKDLTQQLLTFSRGGAPVTRPTELVPLVEDSVAFALRGTNIRGRVSAPDDLWTVTVDPGQMNQVFNNLVINAGQAMPEGGTAVVTLENVTLPGGHPSLLPEGPYVRTSVRDEGVGISREHLDKVFDPYFTTKHRGSGLGLAVSYSIVKSHAGALIADSELGRGATFSVYLPATDARPLASEDAGAVVVAGQGKILVMDDEESIRSLVSQLLAKLGYEVATAPDGATAVELFRNAAEGGRAFDAVLLDLTVPGEMGGLEALTLMKGIDPSVKGIVSSGYSNDPVIAEHRRHGFRRAVAKPFNIEELSRTVREVVADDD